MRRVAQGHLIFWLLLMLGSSFGLADTLDFAPLNPLYEEYLQNPPPPVTSDGYFLGAIPVPVALPSFSPPPAGARGPQPSFPTSYDLRTLGKTTPIRNQGQCGSCWAFATYGSLESGLLTAETWDFSENNLKNLHGFNYACCAGGQHWISTAYLARWSGPVKEADDPYSADPNNCYSWPNLPVQKRIQNVFFLPDRGIPPGETDATIKGAVIACGAVYTTLYIDTATASGYYNSTTGAYYYNGSKTGNHAVCIVGWDDNYSKTNFSTQPTGNGAFICRNSWGTGWGLGGYFYVSYYDTKIGKDNAVFLPPDSPAAPMPTFNTIYQYDPLGWVNSVGYFEEPRDTAWFANVFVTDKEDLLAAVSFYVPVAGSSYELSIYSWPTSGPVNPAGPLLTQSGTISPAGYRTVLLNRTIPLVAREQFSVVVKLTTPGWNWPVAYESALSGYSSQASANAGEGYMSHDGTTWIDFTTRIPTGNVCLKAFGAPRVIHVSPSGSDTNDGTTWAKAKQTIQGGINAAVEGTHVWVAAGTYVETVNLKRGVYLLGGFAGTEAVESLRNWKSRLCIIKPPTASTQRVVTILPDNGIGAMIDGFTICDASTTGPGAGIYAYQASPWIAHNTIINNEGSDGAGIYCEGGNGTTIVNNIIAGNTAGPGSLGGGIRAENVTNLVAISNTIANNAAPDAGGVYLGNTSGIVANCIIANNDSGGIKSAGSATALTRYNCVYGNVSYNYNGITAGTGSISQDPLFTGPGDYHLQGASPCVGAGNNGDAPPDWKDIDCQARIHGTTVDMGADEYVMMISPSPPGFAKWGKWNLVSIPGNPNNPDPLSVFAGIDIANSSFQYWRNDTEGGGYQNYGEFFGWTGPIVRGIPYWFMETTGTPEDKTIFVEAEVPEGDFVLTVPPHQSAPFWIMLGTPSPNPLPAEEVRFRNIEKRGDQWLTWMDAFSPDNPLLRIVDSNAQGWSADRNCFISLTPDYWIGESHIFDPWWGYWLLVYDPAELGIRFPGMQ